MAGQNGSFFKFDRDAGPGGVRIGRVCSRLSMSLLPVCFSMAANTSASGMLLAASVTVVPLDGRLGGRAPRSVWRIRVSRSRTASGIWSLISGNSARK